MFGRSSSFCMNGRKCKRDTLGGMSEEEEERDEDEKEDIVPPHMKKKKRSLSQLPPPSLFPSIVLYRTTTVR